jgi:hypothetical protein
MFVMRHLSLLSCCCTGHSELCQTGCFVKWGWLLLCYMEWDSSYIIWGILCFQKCWHFIEKTLMFLCILKLLHTSITNISWVGQGSAVGIATCYVLDGSGIKSWWRARFSTPVQIGLGAHPASYTVGTGFFLGVKWPGCDDHLPPSRAEVKERVELYLYSPSGTPWPVLGWTLPFFTLIYRGWVLGNK